MAKTRREEAKEKSLLDLARIAGESVGKPPIPQAPARRLDDHPARSAVPGGRPPGRPGAASPPPPPRPPPKPLAPEAAKRRQAQLEERRLREESERELRERRARELAAAERAVRTPPPPPAPARAPAVVDRERLARERAEKRRVQAEVEREMRERRAKELAGAKGIVTRDSMRRAYGAALFTPEPSLEQKLSGVLGDPAATRQQRARERDKRKR